MIRVISEWQSARIRIRGPSPLFRRASDSLWSFLLIGLGNPAMQPLETALDSIEHPVTMTHSSVDPTVIARMGITSDLVRVSIGIEDVEDLIADLDAALSARP